MELTPLDPKLERHLAEVQKILDRDPAMRRKLWIRFIVSFFVLLVILGLYICFLGSFKSSKFEDPASSYSLIVFFLASKGGYLVGMIISFWFQLLPCEFSIKIQKICLKIYDRCKSEFPELLDAKLSDKNKIQIAYLKRTRWVIRVLNFCIVLAIPVIWMLLKHCYNIENNLKNWDIPMPGYFGAIKWIGFVWGVLCGFFVIQLIVCLANSFMKLKLFKNTLESIFFRLREIECEIYKSPGA